VKAGGRIVSILCLAAFGAVFAGAAPGPRDGPGLPSAAGGTPALSLSVGDRAPTQGEPILVRVSAPGAIDNLALVWMGATYPVLETAPGRYEGIVGVDLLDTPGPAVLAAEGRGPGGERLRVEVPLDVKAGSFPVQDLTLPKKMVEFDPPTLRRIRREAQALKERFDRVSGAISWRLPFLPPVEPYRPTNFGSRRRINGAPRSPHAGVDLHVPEGTPVHAIADGIVVFAGEQFFGGRSVVIDHGGGVFSVYYHMKEYVVSEGTRVRRGERIGAVGATGRATGPHLHFSVRVPGGRIDPSQLLGLAGR
jgi:murein DD-endopeptidase MepM/ murein hydrolase activator NlpD